MAPRRGVEVQEQPQLGGLNFNQTLSWRAGKPIATGELLKRLDALSTELRELEQEHTDKESLAKVAKELAGQNLLSHKDKGVRAFTACCLVDTLKLCAPDAPFTGSQLRDIFTLFITAILPSLADPANAYNTQHKYVLVSLAEVKSIILLLDIPNSDHLTLQLFKSFFDIVSGSAKTSTGDQVGKDIEYHMNEILVAVVDEHPNLPTQVVDIILAQFLRASAPGGAKAKNGEIQTSEKQSTLLPKEFPAAYHMAKTICATCEANMAKYISQYFAETVINASNNTEPPKLNGNRRVSDVLDSDDVESTSGPSEQDLKELAKSHELLRELWRASPAVLMNIIPQLGAHLDADNVQLRSMATETLGDIISGIGAAGPPPAPVMDPAAYPPMRLEDFPTGLVSDSFLTQPSSPQSFAQSHAGSYHSFMGREKDKSAAVRMKWTIAVGRILVTSAGGIGLSRDDETGLIIGLGNMLKDLDEKVRIAAIHAVGTFNLRAIMTKLAPNGSVSKSGSVLSLLADRARDRKAAVRVEGMTTLGRIWGVAAGEIADGNESVIAALGAIPSKICDAFYANDKEVNVLLDHVLFEQLLPLSYPPSKHKASKATNGESQSTQDKDRGPFDADRIRVERILLLVKYLDVKSKKAFFAIQARQTPFATVLAAFVKKCEEFNAGVVDDDSKAIKSKLDSVIKYITDFFPDPLRTSADLQKFAKLHERRTYQLLRFAMDTEKDFKGVRNAIKEFASRLQSLPGAPAGLLETFEPIIYRSASLIYNKSHLPALLQFSRSDENGVGATAHEVMHEISQRMPEIFSSNVKELCKSLQETAPSKSRRNDLGSVETLRACAEFAKNRPKDMPKDRKFTEALINFSLYGSPPKAAKYAVSILMAASDRKEMHVKDLLEKTTVNWKYGEDHFLSKLATISQLSLLDSKLADDANDDILDITTQQVLLRVRTSAQETDSSWQVETELDKECQAKMWAIKVLVNRLRGIEDPDSAKETAVPVFKLLNALISKEGEISKQRDTPKGHRSRLRLLAAQSVLKLCTRKTFDDFLTATDFNNLAFVAQDRLANVRRGFVEKLQKYLVKGRLSNRFYTIIFLTAFEPEVEFKNSIITWIRSRTKFFLDKKSPVMESIFARLLSLLTHHPDYSTDPEELKDHARYILYYVTSVASEENVGLIYKYAERVKQARDGINSKNSDRLYVMSDLAQAVIRKWEEKKGWSMQTWPAKVGLPSGIFAALPSHEVAQEIAEKQYLPEEMDDLLNSLVRKTEQKKKRKYDESEGQPSAKKVKSETKTKVSRTPNPKKVREKKTPKSKKLVLGTPAPSSDRRRSGRGASAKKSYADRDSSEDEEEMMEGVAKWVYVDENSDDEQSGEDENQTMSEGSSSPEAELDLDNDLDQEPEAEADAAEAEAELEDEPEPMDEDLPSEEVEPTPPRSNGRRPKAPIASPEKSPAATRTSRGARQKKSPVVTKDAPAPSSAPSSPALPKRTAKTPLVAKAAVRGKAVKGKGRGKKATEADVHDVDESD